MLTIELSHPACGGLKENDPHKPIGSGTIRRYGLVELVYMCCFYCLMNIEAALACDKAE